MQIKHLKPIALSSKYGDGKVFGQPLAKKSIVLVEIETENGLKGVGETYSGVYLPELVIDAINFFSKLLIGLDIDDSDKISKIKDIPYVGRSGLLLSAWSAIDIAIWDIRSKFKNKPLYELLSNKFSSEKKIYSSGGSVVFSPKQIEDDIKKSLDLGHESFKMRVGYQDWTTDLMRVKRTRQILGPNNKLMIDAIMGSLRPCWGFDEAVDKINQLSEYEIYWMEEPLHPANINQYSLLTKQSNVKIASGEALTGSLEYSSYISLSAVNILQLDVTHCGGISIAIEIIELAKTKNIPVALHIWGSPVSFASNLNLAMSSDIIEWVEQPNIPLALSKSFKSFNYEIDKGKIKISEDFIGHGITYEKKDFSEFKFIKGSGWRL